VLVLVGWGDFLTITIPTDPEGRTTVLAKKAGKPMRSHALEVLATMPKPDNVTDEQFAKAKQASLAQAHSGLRTGLLSVSSNSKKGRAGGDGNKQ